MYYKEVSEVKFNKIIQIYSIFHKLGIMKANITTDEDKNGKYLEIRIDKEITPRFIIQIKDLKVKFYIRSEEEC